MKAKLHVEHLKEEGTKVCINDPGHMTKMTDMTLNIKNLEKSSSPEPESL